MKSPFGTSLRRDPADPRGLLERIDAQLGERLTEAVDFACLDLMVQLRRQHGRPLPDAQNPTDQKEFKLLVREFLVHLRGVYWTELSAADRQKVVQAETGARSQELERLVAGQVALARHLPDYWQRFDASRAAFVRARLAAPPPKPGVLNRLLGR